MCVLISLSWGTWQKIIIKWVSREVSESQTLTEDDTIKRVKNCKLLWTLQFAHQRLLFNEIKALFLVTFFFMNKFKETQYLPCYESFHRPLTQCYESFYNVWNEIPGVESWNSMKANFVMKKLSLPRKFGIFALFHSFSPYNFVYFWTRVHVWA